jgi:hypothetical protein
MELEFNTNLFKLNEEYSKSIFANGLIMVTPPIDADYWLFRVYVSDSQAVICFPKFGTFGIGFQFEEDWNTNLPYTCDTMKIYNHIKHNKGSDKISDEVCIEAIKVLQDACKKFVNMEKEA